MAVHPTTGSAFQGMPGRSEAPVAPRLGRDDRALKRGVDLVGSAILLVVLSPLLLAVAVVLLVVYRRPVLFRQARVGWHGEVVNILKFRTMVLGAEALRDAVWATSSPSPASPPPVLFKLRDDPRVTRVGGVLRRFSIDELPQLWNVLRGEMSLVGPRPLPVADHERASGVPGLEERLAVRPGITGPWQVRGRSDHRVEVMIALDLEYLARWSLAQDLRLLAATIPAILRGRGAY